MALLLHLGHTCHNLPLLFFQLQHPSHRHGSTTCSDIPLFIISRINNIISAFFFHFHTESLLTCPHLMPQRKQSVKCLHGVWCGGISWANVGHCGGTPVQRAGSATWMLPVKMATVWLSLSEVHTQYRECVHGGCGRRGAWWWDRMMKQTMTINLLHQCQDWHQCRGKLKWGVNLPFKFPQFKDK